MMKGPDMQKFSVFYGACLVIHQQCSQSTQDISGPHQGAINVSKGYLATQVYYYFPSNVVSSKLSTSYLTVQY